MAINPVEWRLAEISDYGDLFVERSLEARNVLGLSGNPYADKYTARFLERVEVDDNGCWLWTCTLNNRGYARMGMYKRLVLMHRWAYLLFIGPIPQDLELDHLCSTPRCVNPDHLEPVTHEVNNSRGNSISANHARKTHCPQGHLYSEENTYSRPSKLSRECRICKTKHTIASNRRMQSLRKMEGKIA